MTPKELIFDWVEKFNNGDLDGLSALYAKDAVDQLTFFRAQGLPIPDDYLDG